MRSTSRPAAYPRRFALAVVVIASFTAEVAGAPLWPGLELALGCDLSEAPILGTEARHYFPLSGAVTATARLAFPGGVSVVAGAGYDQSVRTEGSRITFIPPSGPVAPAVLEFMGQVRERSSVVPLVLEVAIGGGWGVAAGMEWRHVFATASRVKSASLTSDGTTQTFPGEHTWHEFDVGREDRWAARFALGHRWSGPGGSRSLALRWVEGLQDLSPSPDLEWRHRALQLVLGWSR
jgi:hypothetical protein